MTKTTRAAVMATRAAGRAANARAAKKPMVKTITEKQKRFCEEYLVDRSGKFAAIRAGFSEKSAQVKGCMLLKEPIVMEYLNKLITEQSKRTMITADRVLEEIAKLAFFNMADVIDKETGARKPLNEWSNDCLAAVQEMTDDTIHSEDGEVLVRRKVKISDKKGNLELLGRHLKLFTDKTEHTGKDGGPIEAVASIIFNPVGKCPDQ